MKVGVREVGFREPVSTHPVEWALRRAHELGYDGVELSTVPDRNRARGRGQRRGIWYAEYDASARERLRRTAAEIGIEIPSLSADWAWLYSEFHPTLDGWERGAEILREDIRLARDLGARVILVHFGVSTGSWEQAKRLLGHLAEEAARAGVILGYEGSLWYLTGLGGPETLVKMIDEIASPGLGIYAHPRGSGLEQAAEIRLFGRRLVALHSSAIDPGIDYAPLFAALRDVGYDWYWMFEVPGDLIAESRRAFADLYARYATV